MRYVIILTLGLSVLATGAACPPLFDLDPAAEPTAGTKLAVSVISPAEDHDVPMDAADSAARIVTIEWTAANLTGSPAVATVFVRSRTDFADTILVGGLRIAESGGDQSVEWDTTDFPGGEYSIHVEVEADGMSEEAIAGGRITINTPPAFEFTDPAKDSELVERDPNDPNDPNAVPLPAEVTIGWTSSDPDSDGVAEVGVDVDLDHESGNETTIYEVDIPRTSGVDSIDWDGTDTAGERVESGTYYLFALVSDGVNDDEIVDGLARITIPEEESFELAVTQPEEDTEFLVGDDPLTIEFTLDEDENVFISLRIDPDDNHHNGNEVTILSRYLVEPDTHEDSFDWDGDDSGGDPVDDGIYRIIMAVSRGSGSSQIVEADGLVFRRSDDEQPLIALLKPDSDETVVGGVGGEVLIKWRDDDPSESARIRLTIDDDATPDEGAETDDPEEVIPSADWDDLEAAGDDVEDTFSFYIDDDRAPGRYWIFAYIDRDEAAPWDNVAIAAGQIVVEDPAAE